MTRFKITYSRRAHGAIGCFNVAATPKYIVAENRDNAWTELWELENSAGWEIHETTIAVDTE